LLIPQLKAAAAAYCSGYEDYFDVTGLQVGDTDGDGFPDIVVVVGPKPGYDPDDYPGYGPTLWVYTNNADYTGTGGAWKFQEAAVGPLATSGESAFAISLGFIDLSIFPALPIGLIVAAVMVAPRMAAHRRHAGVDGEDDADPDCGGSDDDEDDEEEEGGTAVNNREVGDGGED
jgi:hypothetical protein